MYMTRLRFPAFVPRVDRVTVSEDLTRSYKENRPTGDDRLRRKVYGQSLKSPRHPARVVLNSPIMTIIKETSKPYSIQRDCRRPVL